MFTHRDIALNAFRGQSWASGIWGTRMVLWIGVIADAGIEMTVCALQSSWLTHENFAPDALPKLGNQVRMPRYPGESEASYKTRLLAAVPIYEAAASEPTIAGQLLAMGIGGAGGLATEFHYPSDGAPWNAIPPLVSWSQFWVVVPAGAHPFGPPTGCGETDATCGVMRCGISDISDGQIAALRAIVHKWKPSDWVAREIRFEFAAGADSALAVQPWLGA